MIQIKDQERFIDNAVQEAQKQGKDIAQIAKIMSNTVWEYDQTFKATYGFRICQLTGSEYYHHLELRKDLYESRINNFLYGTTPNENYNPLEHQGV